MKKIFTLIAMALVAVGVNAADRLWKFSDDAWTKVIDTEGKIFATTTVEGLKVWADDGKDSGNKDNGFFAIDGSNKTISGIACTKRLKSGGSTNASETRTSRCLSLDVTGNCKITIAATSSNSTDSRTMLIASAPTSNSEDASVKHVFTVAAGNPVAYEYDYEGEATTLYICFAGGGVNLYYVSGSGNGMPEYEEPDPEQQTAANSWDFTVIDDADAAAMKNDADWTKTLKDDGETVSEYKYSKALNEAAATAGGTELNVTKGLKFTVKADQLIFTPGSRLNMGGNGRNVIIPNLVKNDYVVVEYKPNGETATGRGFALPSNCELVEGALTSSTTDVTTFKIKVKKSGSVTLTSIEGVALRKIALNQAIPTGIQTAKAQQSANAAAFNLAGQKVGADFKGIVIKNGKKMLQK